MLHLVRILDNELKMLAPFQFLTENKPLLQCRMQDLTSSLTCLAIANVDINLAVRRADSVHSLLSQRSHTGLSYAGVDMFSSRLC